LLKPKDGAISIQKQQNRKTQNKKEGAQAPFMLRLHDGVHLLQKQQKKEGEPKLHVCQYLVMVPNCA
jgi:hypothetical protein